MFIKYHNLDGNYNDSDSTDSFNIFIKQAQAQLFRNRCVSLELQPGDGTCYKIYIMLLNDNTILIAKEPSCQVISVDHHIVPQYLEICSCYLTNCLIADLINAIFNNTSDYYDSLCRENGYKGWKL